MNITVSNPYGNPVVTWEKPEGEELHYDVLIRTVSGADSGNTGMMMYNVPVDYETFRAGDYIAYYAQEHEYYGPLSFQVTAYDKETAVAQGTSDIILAADCFPSVKELVFGEDVKPEDITMISYSGTGSMAGDNFHYTLYKEDDEYLLDADFYDETGEHTVDHPVDAEIFEQAKARIHRAGQKEKCHYIYLVCKGTVDGKVLSALRQKQNLAKMLVDDYRKGKNPFRI